MQERRIHQIFHRSVLLKGAHAATECVGGFALALTNNHSIRHFVARAAESEWIEDKRDLVANHLVTYAQSFSIETRYFYA